MNVNPPPEINTNTSTEKSEDFSFKTLLKIIFSLTWVLTIIALIVILFIDDFNNWIWPLITIELISLIIVKCLDQKND